MLYSLKFQRFDALQFCFYHDIILLTIWSYEGPYDWGPVDERQIWPDNASQQNSKYVEDLILLNPFSFVTTNKKNEEKRRTGRGSNFFFFEAMGR
jgi:hypothetical protein